MSETLTPPLEAPQDRDAMGELEIRDKSSQIASVSFPKREVELIVMPYEQETIVEHHGRPIWEIVSRGAFRGVERRIKGKNRVVANRDHDPSRLLGKAVALHPSRDEGLVAVIRISETELGNETLTLADDGILDASAGFRLLQNRRAAEVWERRDRRRLNHLWLDHIAFTPEPAYQGAQVLAVRRKLESPPVPRPASTPNRDRLRDERLLERYDRIPQYTQI